MPPHRMFDGQADLRWSMEQLADEAFERAGLDLDARGYLIGLPEADPAAPVAVEPSRRAFDLTALDHALETAQQQFEQLPEPTHQDDFTASALYGAARLEACRRHVVAAALTDGARSTDRVVRVGLSVVVGSHRVFPVLAIDRAAMGGLPRLAPHQASGLVTDESFPEAIVADVLRAASRELDRVHPSTLVGVDAGAVLRAAADSFVNSAVSRTGQEYAHGLRDTLDAVSAETYEGRAGLGSLVLAARDHPAVEAAVHFEQEIPLTAPSHFRKMLEMSGRGLRLLTDGRVAFGLGTLRRDRDRTAEDCFAIDVVGNGAWELLCTDGQALLRMDHGQPSVPTEAMNPDTFADTVRRVFGDDGDAERLWDMAQACAGQQHGTTLVVHPAAATEGARLLPQAFPITPTVLTGRAFKNLTKIDGAVLVDPQGACHAVGVILDGAATGTGDASRGARYNSAIRYLAGEGRGSMVIIVSEDGTIDLLPTLMRRVRRATVQARVEQFTEAVADHEDHEKIARLDRACQKVEFYLTAAQCEQLNAAREAVEERRWAEERVRQQVVPVQPHPGMDDSYFLDVEAT